MGKARFRLSDLIVTLPCLLSEQAIRYQNGNARSRMSRRSMTRLATAVTAAGTICALGAGAAVAAPAASWSGPSAPIPGAFTNNSPALSTVAFPGPIGQGTLVAWRGRGAAGHIFYKFRTPHRGWSKLGEIPGANAITNVAPAIRGYKDPLGRNALLAVWTGHADHHIWYSQGETRTNGTIGWTKPAVLPKTVALTNTIEGPSVFFPNNRNLVIVAWRAPFNHVRFSIGIPAKRNFKWSNSTVVPGNPPSPTKVHCKQAPCTSATPAIAEVQTGTARGTLYIFWKQLGTRHVFYSTTTDNGATNWSHLVWSGPARVPGAATLLAPTASSVRLFGPLLLAYKAPFGTHIRFQTLTKMGWSAVGVVPAARTTNAPALLGGTLAHTKPTSVGNIVLHHFTP